jgi:alpha-L-rhamnosidase
MKPFDLRCEYEADPLGIDVPQPRLSWKLQDERRGASQSAYRVLVASSEELLSRDEADLWDSGEVQSADSVWVQYQGQSLSSRQRAFWKVQVRDEQGNASEYSDVTWFETGLLGEQLGGEWIGSSLAGGARNGAPAPYLRKAFLLEGQIKSARLYATALGLYEYSINGTRVGNDVFTPGWTDYHTRVQLHTYDVTELLQNGNNACGAILGDGWYCGHVDWRDRQSYGDRPKLRAQLVVTFDDGRTQSIETDASWKYSLGAIVQNDLIMGEHFDARREIEGWNTTQFDDNGWNAVETFQERDIEICAPLGPPVRRQEELKPIEIKTIYKWPTHDYIFDMGQNMVGRVRLKLKGEAGLTVRLRHAEVLNPDGTLYTENLRTALQTDYYTFKSDEVEEWEPRFTFHGFRYVEIKGLKKSLRSTLLPVLSQFGYPTHRRMVE